MTDSNRATVDRTDGRPRNAGPGVLPAMLTINQVARLLNCSTRTVYRLNDAGRMPRPVRLGALVRWNRGEIEQWIADGCPAPANPAVKGGRR
ncbi:helix-turn-helix transcriptional regulator [Mucisphaera calidilacus]|uniref:Prophage CP4-57 regulatory protein (AlpA) n=1 Tax=Mucisphaera calidilacus TaxID=2527982 RepID=A0A518C065_9BACT|nr:helix-turn-helix domain-containing protein [Mucisphaera calidilacus]QDU72616.1 Prophage CP4-57 regulatory protein (AlpA) [Mucisphaera calidilacus]